MKRRILAPAQLDKVSEGGTFKSLVDAGVCKFNCNIASTLTARYYKGVAGHHDNMVIQIDLDGDNSEFEIV